MIQMVMLLRYICLSQYMLGVLLVVTSSVQAQTF